VVVAYRCKIPAFAWRNIGKSQKASVKTPGVPYKIRSQHLSKRNLERHSYTNLLGYSDAKICIIAYFLISDDICASKKKKDFWVYNIVTCTPEE
jgi:hypothetical protein